MLLSFRHYRHAMLPAIAAAISRHCFRHATPLRFAADVHAVTMPFIFR